MGEEIISYIIDHESFPQHQEQINEENRLKSYPYD